MQKLLISRKLRLPFVDRSAMLSTNTSGLNQKNVNAPKRRPHQEKKKMLYTEPRF